MQVDAVWPVVGRSHNDGHLNSNDYLYSILVLTSPRDQSVSSGVYLLTFCFIVGCRQSYLGPIVVCRQATALGLIECIKLVAFLLPCVAFKAVSIV